MDGQDGGRGGADVRMAEKEKRCARALRRAAAARGARAFYTYALPAFHHYRFPCLPTTHYLPTLLHTTTTYAHPTAHTLPPAASRTPPLPRIQRTAHALPRTHTHTTHTHPPHHATPLPPSPTIMPVLPLCGCPCAPAAACQWVLHTPPPPISGLSSICLGGSLCCGCG